MRLAFSRKAASRPASHANTAAQLGGWRTAKSASFWPTPVAKARRCSIANCICRERDLVENENCLRDRGPLADLRSGEAQEFLFPSAGSRDKLHIDHRHLAQTRVGPPNRGGQGDRRVPVERLLDLPRIDVVPPADDQL